jgi:hypothetical protein
MVPVFGFIDFILPLASAKKTFCDPKAGIKFPKKLSPENGLVQFILIFTELLIGSSVFGSSESASSLPQNFIELNEEHEDSTKSTKNIAINLLAFIFNKFSCIF